METPDIFNSKIKKIRIELPDYHFNHTSSGDSSHDFIGRERMVEKLKSVLIDSPNEPGVYMVTGNRGVGKTSLVNKAINETSLQQNDSFFKKLRILFGDKNGNKNFSRLYLRINFGHKLRDEKDILRLIARTLSTEYGKYRRSFWRMLPWRGLALGILFLLACLFNIGIKNSNSIKQWETNYGVFFNVDTNADFKVKTKEETTLGTMAANLLLELDRLVKTVIISTYYRFWLPFLLMYLFFVLLFRSTWITPFFVTHRIIARRLKKLNSDITHSTEREYSISANAERGLGIGTRTKKSRNVADAREIEKELQDILDDMRRIPRIMCRPQVVIVFDELDKVEPGDAGLEKEAPQTKASMFSIGATRERQTEILRILSNMKYFLSTVRAKFIFIAGREMYDIHLADVSERNNYIGSIFNAVIHVPSFLTDHPTGKKSIREESSIASLPEEFVCRRLIPHGNKVKTYNLKSYRTYLEKNIFCKDTQKEEIQKIIAVLQQFIIYLAHVSKGAPKKMMQLFESFVEVSDKHNKNKERNLLIVRQYDNSKYFLTFNYYKQYTLGIIAYLITPIFYRLSESNIKEHSDKLLISTLRFVDFLFKFHKHSFSWKHLEISPEMMEPNRAPELKSVAVELLNYLSQVHINKSSFSLYDYKFDSWIANEIFTMTKTDDVFSALFSFSLDEMLPLKQHYRNLLENAEKEYRDDKISTKYIDAISSLQIVLGDLCYYDDELEEAGVYYKNAVEMLRKDEGSGKMNPERLYLYVRNKLKVGMIHEKRKQYDFAYLTYSGLCDRIIRGQHTISNVLLGKRKYDELKLLYLPFIAKLQILEKSHSGGITRRSLRQMENEFGRLTVGIDPEEAKYLKAEFYSRVADILYYKNSDLMKCRKSNSENGNKEISKNCSCTACHYYRKALCSLLCRNDKNTTVITILHDCVEQLDENHNMEYCTILARILSDWGNVFFSCDNRITSGDKLCYVGNNKIFNTPQYCCQKSACRLCSIKKGTSYSFRVILDACISYVKSESNRKVFLGELNPNNNFLKMEMALAMYSISSKAYRRANQFKRSAYQMYKMLCLFKYYKLYKNGKSKDYIKELSNKALCYLWHASDDLNVFELNKRKKDFDKDRINEKIPLQNLLVDSEITKIRILVKELELKSNLTPKELSDYYGLYITSPYRINYSIGGRIYRLRLKSIVNYKAYQQILGSVGICGKEIDFVLREGDYRKLEKNKYVNMAAKEIFGQYFKNMGENVNAIVVLENIIAETIYCLVDIVQLAETMGETYVFTHSFFGSIHEHLSFWIRQYEEYEKYKNGGSRIGKLLETYLDEEWRELLSGYRENRQALLHYHKCLEMHSEGRAYHNMIDTMCYVKDDYNDSSDHFNIAEERHYMLNMGFKKNAENLRTIYRDSKLHDVDNYYDS
jgi:hypothetical protein